MQKQPPEGYSVKKVFLEISQNSLENTVPKTWNFIKKETQVQVFSCEFYEISKNTFFTEHLWMSASANVLRINEKPENLFINISWYLTTYIIIFFDDHFNYCLVLILKL